VRNFELNPRTEEGAENLATLATVGVPLINLVVAAYLFVTALMSANDGGEMSASTGWTVAVAASASSGVLLATALFWLASRARRADRARSQARAMAARLALRHPALSKLDPSSVTMVVRHAPAANGLKDA
jgi:hypothetical protein